MELAAPACQTGGMSADSVPPDTIATLRIDLLDSDPPIWREIEVPISMTLKELHAVVQAAMEWENAHLWEFAVGRERIGSSRAAKLSLASMLRPRTTKLTYIYDFGDGWEHQLTLTKPSRRRSKLSLSALHRRRARSTARGLRRHPWFLYSARNPRRSQAPRSQRR